LSQTKIVAESAGSVALSTPFVTGADSTACTAGDAPSKRNAEALVQAAPASVMDAW